MRLQRSFSLMFRVGATAESRGFALRGRCMPSFARTAASRVVHAVDIAVRDRGHAIGVRS